jgi:hypothetical protein
MVSPEAGPNGLARLQQPVLAHHTLCPLAVDPGAELVALKRRDHVRAVGWIRARDCQRHVVDRSSVRGRPTGGRFGRRPVACQPSRAARAATSGGRPRATHSLDRRHASSLSRSKETRIT